MKNAVLREEGRIRLNTAMGWINSHFNFPERTLGLNATQWNRKVSHGPKRLDSVLINFVGFGGLIFNPLVTCLTDICHRGNPVGPYQCDPRGSWGRKCGSNPKRKASGETGNSKPRCFAGECQREFFNWRSQLSLNFLVKEDQIQLEILV